MSVGNFKYVIQLLLFSTVLVDSRDSRCSQELHFVALSKLQLHITK